MNRKNTKKLLSVILSLVMVLSYLPASSFAFAVDGEAGPVVEADSNAGNDTTVNTDTGADNDTNTTDTNTTDGSDQVTEGDKEDPPAVDDKKDEQAEPKEEGKKVEANTEAKEPAKGSEDEGEEPEEPANAPKDVASGDHSADIMDFIPPGTITMIHKKDNSPVTESNPAIPGETVLLALTNIRETIGEDQFDMTDEMTMEIPAGLDPPNPSETGTSTVYVTDYSVNPPQVYEMDNTYVIGSDGVIRYQWNTDCKEERPPGSGNIVDVYALACQAENFKYDLSFEIKVGSDADSIDFGHGFTFPVDRSVALTVKKDIEIPGMTSISQTDAQQMTFGVFNADGTPVMKDGQPVTFTRNDMTGSGLTNAKWEISGLTAAEYPATFIVRETGHPEIEGYTFLTSGDNVVTEQTVEIPAGQSANAHLKNRYTKDASRLKIKKAFPEGDKTSGNLTTAEKQKISFKVYDQNDNLVGEANLSETNKFDLIDGEYVWDLGTLPPGEYTVIETADLDGYTRTTTYKVDSNAPATGTTASVTLVTDQNHVVEFDNSYERQNGTLKIKKTFAGATDSLSDADKNKIKFAVTAPDGTVTNYTYAQFTNGVLTIDPALAGTYKVVESNTGTTNYTVATTYQVIGGTSGSGSTANVTVPYNETGEVDYTNTYTELGKITLTKAVGGNYWASSTSQSSRRSRIRNAQYNLYRVNADGTRTKVGNTITLATNQGGYFYNTGTYTWSNLPVGNYEIDEVMTDTNGTYGSVISNTTRTTTVTVNGGIAQTTGPVEGGNTVKTGSFSVTKGGTSTVAYQNDYYKKQGKIKLDKKVFIDGAEVNPSTLTEDQQKAMKFKITGKDVYGNNESKEVSLYDILNHQNGVDAEGYITIDYSNSTGYKVTESGADLANYIRVTTGKLDNGEFGPGASVSSIKINDTTTSHSVTFKNEYSSRGRLMVDKTVEGLSASDETTVRGQIYFTIADSSGRPIVKENGKYVLGQAGATPAQIPLSELTAENGIELPTGTYVLTEHNGEFNTEIYTWSVTNVVINDGQQIDPRNSAVSGNATVTLGNVKHVEYTNKYTRTAIGPGGGVSVIKKVLLDGVEIDASYGGVHGQLYNTVINKIRFKIYEGTEVNDANLIEGCPDEGYTLAQLRDNPPILYVGTYTIQETNYDVDHYNHAIHFTVNGVTTRDDHVTITVARNQHVNVYVYNGYIPLGELEVLKVIDDTGDLKAADLTSAQKQAIKFSVIGYKDTSYSEVVWPKQEEGATEPQPYEFTYADMTANADGIMSKLFRDIPIGVYVVKEESADIPNYNVSTVEDPDSNAVEVHWNTSGNEKAVKKFTNKYTRQKGKLEVTKTFGDTPNTLPASERRKIKFTVYDSAGNVVKEFTYAQMTGGHYTIEDLETGTYTVKETNADFDFFERTTTATVNGETTTYSDENGVSASVENDATADVHITNEYQETGALIINKSFDFSESINELTDAQKKAIEFTIWRVKEDGSKEVVKTITYAQILTWIQQHPTQDPAGYRMLVLPGDYIIEESNADFPGYDRTTTATVDGTSAEVSEDSVPATVAKFDEQTVVVTNKYDEKGKLKVKKTVEDLTLNDAQKAAIKFTVTKDNDVVAEFTYADILNQPGQVYVIDNLAAGNYVVSETVDDEESVFYGKTRRTFVKVGNAGEIENSSTGVQVDSKEKTVIFRNKYGNTDQLVVQKEIGGAPTAYIVKDGSQYPVWKFNLRISNLELSTVNSDGSTDIIDYIDNKALLDLFEVVTDPADLAKIDAKDHKKKKKANKLTTDGDTPTANVTLEEDYDNGKVIFHITGVTAETATSNDLIYYLIPKDAEALETLNAREGTAAGTPSNQLKKYFSNVAEYKKLPLYDYGETNKVDYEYEKTVVKKSCLNYNSTVHHLTDEYGNPVDYALYQFIINPEEMRLSSDGYLDVVDEFSANQSVDQESITVERCVYDLTTGEVTSTSPAEDGDVTLKDLVGNKILLTLKDETCFRVTYMATMLYTAEQAQHGTPIELQNTVTVKDYSDGEEPVVIPQSHGGGSVYRIRLRKYQEGNLDNGLLGAEFKMYLNKAAADAARTSGDYSQAVGTYSTDANGVITINDYKDANGNTHHVSAGVIYYFVESVAPTGYEKINYTVQVQLAAEGDTAHYDQYIYLPNDTVGIKDTPFDTSVDLGALKTFVTNGSARQLEEGDFTFQIRAKNNANIPMPEQTEVSNDADGKAVFGAIAYDTEDVITRDPRTKEVTGTSKTFTYLVNEVLPDGLDAHGNKEGVHYDSTVYEVAVTVEIVNGELKVTSVTVNDGKETKPITPDNNVYFAGLENEYTAEGTWTPVIQKDLKGRPLKNGEFTFQIKKGNEVLATGTNDADGNVSMEPESLTFTLDDLGDNNLTVHEVYQVVTDDGMKVVAADVPVTVNVAEKQNKDGTLVVTSDPPATLTAPIVMTNEFEATGSWHPKAEKTLTGALKLNEGDFEFELAAVGDAPMPAGATDGKKVVACDEDGKVDFGQIDFYQDKDPAHQDGDKTFHYTIKEVIPDPADRIFGVNYDDTVYNITVKTTINKTKKLGVEVTCNPKTGWDLDTDTATFTAQFENTYNPGPAKAQPGFDKGLKGVEPADDLTFEFKLEKAAGENGDFDYVKVEKNGELKEFETQTKTLTLGPTSLSDSGLFDELTFLAEGTYKFKITETPNTNGALDTYIYYDPTVYTYTVVVTGEGTQLQATGAYSIEGGQSEETPETAAFTNKYTPAPTVFTPKVHKTLNGEPTVEDKTFEFVMTPDGANPDKGAYHGDTPFQGDASETIEIVVPAGQKDAEKAFETIDFKKAGTYVFHVEETDTTQPGVTNDPLSLWDLTIEVEDQGGKLKVISSDAVQVGGDLSSEDGTVTFSNVYTPNPVQFAPPVKKVMEGEPLVKDKTFTFTIEAASGNPKDGAEIANNTTSITVPAGETNKEGAFEAITFKKAGTYNFTIKETTGNIQQIGYSQEVSYLKVVIKDTDPDLVVDDFEFKEAATAGGASAEFTNTYTPTPTTEIIPVEKTVPGEPLVKEKKFTFKLKPDTGNKKGGVFIGEKAFEGEAAEDTVVLTVPAGEINAHDVFKTLTFKKAGTYKFNVFEVIPADPDKYQGITYDETIGTVVIVVEDTDLKLEVTDMSFEDAVNDDGTAALFSNPYCPEPVDYTPQVEKTVVGHPTVAEKIFNFTLTPDPENKSEGVFLDDVAFEGEDAEDTTTVVVPAGEKTATADFSKLQFRKAGTYKFTVSEQKEDEEGITYDEEVGTLTVVVTDMDGWLDEKHEYVKAEVTDEDYAKFANDYTPEPVVEILHGFKVIDGEPQKDEEFNFKLESSGNTAQLPDGSYIPNPMPEEDEVTIYGDGEFEFGDMTYEWPGEYYYKISLEAATTYTSDADPETLEELATFTNPYRTNELKITKTVKGASGDKKFKFTVRLFDKNGDPLEGVYPITGDAEGEVVNGVGTVKLAHGEEAYVTEIPVDATWIVEEEDYANYKASCDNDHGTITVDKASESNWINTTGVDTGDHNTVGGYLGLFGTSLMALAAMIFGRRRRRENEE